MCQLENETKYNLIFLHTLQWQVLINLYDKVKYQVGI